MSVVRFHCKACGTEFPPSLESCSRCGKTERSSEMRAKQSAVRAGRGWRLGAAWMSVVAAALGIFVAVMCAVARDAFFGVVVGAVVSVFFANIAAGAFRNRRGAFLAGVIASFFPSALFLVRVLEIISFLFRTEVPDRQQRGMRMDAAVFSGCFAFFGILLMLHFIAWLKHRPGGPVRD